VKLHHGKLHNLALLNKRSVFRKISIPIVVAFVLLLTFFLLSIRTTPPHPSDLAALDKERVKVNEGFYYCGANYLKKNNDGLWEMYLEGNGFERGVFHGKLAQELVQQQEDFFVNRINQVVPGKNYLNVLKYFVAWFNRDLDSYIDNEYQLEIYGVSRFASDKYDYIAPKYQRILNYHGAHDIGHALSNMYLVGCTSFSAWDVKTSDHSLIIGRNFDFYFGDEFAHNKIIAFVNPDSGYQFMMVTWGGMIGVVSGMNMRGVTVTINAAKSEIPSKGKMPVSIVTRKILQYAKNIEEAFEIAKACETFVSESIMIGSANDNKTAIIEKTPKVTALYSSDKDYIVCSNHFQGEAFKDDKLNKENLRTTDSPYRYKRVEQLIAEDSILDVADFAAMLRDQRGLDDKDIGMGNQKAINQLIAHHSVIFKPSDRKFWISTDPYQLGKFVCYDLNKVFNDYRGLQQSIDITEPSLAIAEDSFLHSDKYKSYLKFKTTKNELSHSGVDAAVNMTDQEISRFIETNPEYYLTYSLMGDYFQRKKDCGKAKYYFNIALTKEIATATEEEQIREKIGKCSN